jgi:RNA recognition motif-containing protein
MRAVKSVKVSNIPRDVNMQDIKDAFEQETGKIARCKLDKGTAWIAFTKHSDARKAVDTFDRGELNGNTIGVVLDP